MCVKDLHARGLLQRTQPSVFFSAGFSRYDQWNLQQVTTDSYNERQQ